VSTLGAQVFGNAQAAAAVAELQELLRQAPIPLGQQTFIGLTQTLPRLMANGWTALAQHPAELARRRAEPQLMGRAVEELMRYAPIIQMVSRRAMADVDLAGERVAEGGQVNLMLAVANRDPEHFRDPEALDVSRREGNQLALGIGRDSCAGAVAVRMIYAAATAALLEAFAEIEPAGPVEWRQRSVFRWPAALPVTCVSAGS